MFKLFATPITHHENFGWSATCPRTSKMGFALFQDPLAHQGIEMTADSGWSEVEALRESDRR